VLVELREISLAGVEGIALGELGRRVRQDRDEQDPYWLHAAVESLCKDGLAKISSKSRTAKTLNMVAEERAPYGAGPEEPQSPALDERVSLP
jgi:hypothetical protein